MKTQAKRKKNTARFLLQLFLPIAIVIVSLVVSFLLLASDQNPEIQPKTATPPPRVAVVSATFAPPLPVTLSGTVTSQYNTQITSEVTGEIAWVSEKFVNGGYFKAGEQFLQVDDADYRANIAALKAELADAKLNVQKESELAKQAQQDWQDLGRGLPTPLALRKPNLAVAEAQLEKAQAALKKAYRELAKTSISAPFDCMIATIFVSKGSFVTSGTGLCKIFSVDTAEIRLALSPQEAAFSDLPDSGSISKNGKKVLISWVQNKTLLSREGYVSRTEGKVDPETRFQHLVVRVDDPYGFDHKLPELKIGSFVEVEVPGKRIPNAVLLPETALANDRRLLRVNGQEEIEFVTVDLLRRIDDAILIKGAIHAGERIIVSPLTYAVKGMKVAILGTHGEDHETE